MYKRILVALEHSSYDNAIVEHVNKLAKFCGLGLDTVFFSFSTADEDYHAPNEFFRVHRLHEGLEAWARYWEILGEVHP